MKMRLLKSVVFLEVIVVDGYSVVTLI